MVFVNWGNDYFLVDICGESSSSATSADCQVCITFKSNQYLTAISLLHQFLHDYYYYYFDCLRNLKSSQNALLLSGPITLALGVLTSFSGLVLYTVYKDCDPVLSKKIDSYDQIMPYFAAERMSRVPGIAGLFISGIFSASLSTISAMLNSLAAVAIEDYVKPVCRRFGVQFPTEKAALIAKLLVVLNGFNCLALAFLAKSMGSLVQAALGISGAITGPILGIFTLGMFVERANETGAIVGTVSALMTCLWAAFGEPKPPTPALPLSVDGCENATLLLDHRNAIRFDE